MGFRVTERAQRPARMDGRCFYCGRVIDADHKDNCVLIQKKVKVRMTVEYEIGVPAFWSKGEVEFHRNEGSWCSDNALPELEELANAQGCLCQATRFEYLGGDAEPYLDEG